MDVIVGGEGEDLDVNFKLEWEWDGEKRREEWLSFIGGGGRRLPWRMVRIVILFPETSHHHHYYSRPSPPPLSLFWSNDSYKVRWAFNLFWFFLCENWQSCSDGSFHFVRIVSICKRPKHPGEEEIFESLNCHFIILGVSTRSESYCKYAESYRTSLRILVLLLV